MTLSRIRCRASRFSASANPTDRRLGRSGFLLAAMILTAGASLSACLAAPDSPLPAAKRKAGAGTLMAPMAVHWKFTSAYFPNNPASPVIVDGVLYFAGGNRLYAIDAETGAQKWRYPADEKTNLSTVITGTPIVSNGVVYFGAGDGLYALNAADGKQKWPHYDLRAGVVTAPLLIKDTIYFGGGNARIYAINAETGTSAEGIWNQKGTPGIPSGGDFAGDIAALNDTIYYVTNDQVIRAVNLTGGNQKWAQRMNASFQRATPVVNGEFVYLAAGNWLYSWRAASGQMRVSANVGTDITANPAIDSEGNAYVVNSDRNVYAIDGRSRGLWRQSPKVEYEVIAQPVVADNLLIIGTTLGGVYAYDKATGALKWHYLIQPSATDARTIPSSTNVSAQPLVLGATLYVLTDDGTITAFRHDAPDNLPPTVKPLEPEVGDYLNGRSPFRIAAVINDDGSGLDINTLQLQIDGKGVTRRPNSSDFSEKPGFTFDPDNGLLEYNLFDSTLADGHHTVLVAGKDWMGNTVSKTWTFYVDDTIPRRAKRTTNGRNQTGRNTSGGAGGKGTGGGGNGRRGGGGAGGGE